MSKNIDLFGDLASLPEPVNREKLQRPNINQGNYTDYEEVSDTPDPFANIDDMISDDIADDLLKGVGDIDQTDEEAPFDEPPIDDGGLNVEDAIDADMIYEVWADIRLGLHTEAYDWAVYKNPKQVKKVLRELGLKNNKSVQEQELYKNLSDYIDQHDALRGEYRQSVPYTDKHQELFKKFIEKEIQKARLKGKKFPVWLVVAYLFVWPEIKAGAKFWKLRQEIPDLKIDFDL